MASNGITGTGTTIQGATSPLIAEITGARGLEQTAADIDLTNFESTAIETIAGLVDRGEIEIDIWYKQSQANTLQGRLAQAAEVWTITFSDTTTLTITAYIKKLGLAIPLKDGVSQTLTLKDDGTVVPAWAAAP